MAMSTASGNEAFLATEIGELVVQPVEREAVAAIVSTVVQANGNKFRVPVVTGDPSAAWVPEGGEIPLSDAALDQASTSFFKVAGLTIVTRELADDSSPEAAQIIGDGLARDIARKIDAAYFGTTTTNGPSGLKSLTTSTASAGGTFTNLDPFIAAIYGTEGYGVSVNHFVANPTDAQTLSQLKQGTASNVPLLGSDPTKPGSRTIQGVPLITSPAVTAGTIWGIPTVRSIVVIRDDATLDIDRSVYFTSDRVAIRATMRVGWVFPQPLAIQKITKA